MGHRCAVPGCGHYQKRPIDEYSFYTVPQDSAKRKRWMEILRIDEGDFRKDLRVCGRHFTKEYRKCRRLSGDVFPVFKVIAVRK
jgi:hypothetical protein